MRNRELLINKIELMEGYFKTLKHLTGSGGTLEQYLDFLSRSEDRLEEIKSMIEREDMTPNELNRY